LGIAWEKIMERTNWFGWLLGGISLAGLVILKTDPRTFLPDLLVEEVENKNN
jgi:hypothetical protein